jgi:hypothetical protein
MLRTRVRTATGVYIIPKSPLQETSETLELMYDDAMNPKIHTPCLHIKYQRLANGFDPISDEGVVDISDLPVALRLSERVVARIELVKAPPPRFVKNNKFDLLPFLAELDDTLAMFSLKFIKNFSYGAFTWGIMPFLNDVRALTDSYRDITRGYEHYFRTSQQCEDEYKLDIEFDDVMLNPKDPLFGRAYGKAAVRAQASAAIDRAYDKINRMYFLLDEVGANPDAAAIWDSIPLSFVVDYFTNIGEVLESFHPRGWADWEWTAYGHHSFRGNFEHEVRSSKGERTTLASYGKLYVRTGLRPIPVKRSASPELTKLTWKSPSLRQWFNVTYLFTILGKII